MLHHTRSTLRRSRNDRDVEILFRSVLLQLRNRSNRQRLPPLTDLRFVDVVNRGDDESTLRESAVAGESCTDLTGADDADSPLFAESEYLAQLLRKLRNRVAEAALAKGSEEREILANLSGRRPTEPCELVARNGTETLALDPLEEAQIEGKASDCRFCDPLQIMLVK